LKSSFQPKGYAAFLIYTLFDLTSSQYDATLNPHKTKDGYPCPSRTGMYVTTKY